VKPKCCKCDAEADWQIGSYRPFQKYAPVSWCNEHLPASMRELFAKQHAERQEAERRLEGIYGRSQGNSEGI